ncbi:RNA polymerase sigma-54 factor 1 [Variovorax sp. PBL-H6]|uniref:RNA polymerase factor sigma-54 n=1 Tax=Variovorax sp. PBL-H6 TaxID=434009 RepID=UPI001315D750|nr:RNA polymerase factor sigma-54 [Variovorax sp. PBL-H6]VTU39443.1 RNA polymerase sigma-54 factor 1 [Variovorax sp. PBL-H6]
MSSISLQARPIQTIAFSPRLQQAVRLLQLSALDYAQALHEAADANPFLELEEAPGLDSPGFEGAEWSAEAAFDRLGAGPALPGARLSHDESADALQRIPATVSLREHLHAQLGVLRLDAQERLLAAAVVESLDDDGYLRVSLDEIGALVGDAGEDVLPALNAALTRVQSLDPAGVAARSVSECLLLQLGGIDDAPMRELARGIVTDHLEDLASRNWQRIATALGEPVARIKLAAERIRKLDARPGWRLDAQAPAFVTPDVIVRKRRGVWTVALNEATVPRVKLHHTYARMLEQQGVAANPELRGCLESARWTVQNVGQRVSTIRDVAQAIVAKQKLFFDYGPLAMKPLGLREIADAVGVHPSTVSRAVHHKYMATPAGVFELRYFFSRGMQHAHRGASAPTALRQLVGELIAAEPSGAPLSDAELARRLTDQGFRIARRTVTKYRQALRIDPIELRAAARA